MSKQDENVFTKKLDIKYREPAVEIDFNEFDKVVRSRRSVRVFSEEPIADADVHRAIDHALLAPNSSNLQPWEFYIVKTPEIKKELAKYCFSQNGAKTASHLIVCVAKTNTWKKHCDEMIKAFKESGEEVPPVVEQYYKKIAPSAYGLMGPFGILSPFKWLLLNIVGLFRVMARGPVWPSDLKTWAVKTTALACENIMLSLRAQGHDSLPMEGFDECRVKKLLGLDRHSHVVMVIAAGKRSESGIYGPQLRFPRDWFVHEI
jgi:nitroreductase